MLGNDYVVALNLAESTPAWLQSLSASPMTLGLDLRGGVHFLLEVDMDKAIEARVNVYESEIRNLLRSERVRYRSMPNQGNVLQFGFTDDEQLSDAQRLVSADYNQFQMTTVSREELEVLRLTLTEAEMAENIPRTLRVMMYGMSGTVGGSALVQDKPADARWLDDRIDPGVPPGWCSPEAFQVYVDTFERSGFHGPVNWYRNFERNWERTESLGGKQVDQPALFIIGDSDPVGELESYTIKKMPGVVPRVEQHVIANCGHWIQCEKPEPVNQLLMEFLAREFNRSDAP
jgi:hypothetical protein